jgi:hypothetical protein
VHFPKRVRGQEIAALASHDEERLLPQSGEQGPQIDPRHWPAGPERLGDGHVIVEPDLAILLAAIALCHRDEVFMAIILECRAVVGGNRVSSLIPVPEPSVLPDVGEDPIDSGRVYVRTDIVQDRCSDALRGHCSHCHRDQPAERRPDKHRALDH